MAATNERTAELLGHYQAGAAAMRAEDWAAYDEQMRLVLEIEPGHPAVMRHVARACAMTGRFDEARSTRLIRKAFYRRADEDCGKRHDDDADRQRHDELDERKSAVPAMR